MTSLRLTYGAASNAGLRRRRNEDALLAEQNVFAVADGVGGHAAGEIASALAVDFLVQLAGKPDVTVGDVADVLRDANAALVAHGAAHPARAGLATTVAALVLSEPTSRTWIVANVGDSRVYQLRTDGLHQLTVDHSEVAELLAAGHLTKQQARRYPRRHVVTRSLGTQPAPDADFRVLPAHAGERFVVCSDGLTSEVADEQIVNTLQGAAAPEAAADALVTAALDAGGRDNVSVIVVDVHA
jgi:protein phosphatase